MAVVVSEEVIDEQVIKVAEVTDKLRTRIEPGFVVLFPLVPCGQEEEPVELTWDEWNNLVTAVADQALEILQEDA